MDVLVTLILLFISPKIYTVATNSNIFRDHQYTVLATQSNFDQSRQSCIDQGGYLAVVTDEGEQDFIINLITSNSGPGVVWIGMRKPSLDNMDLHWLDNDIPFIFGDFTNHFQPWEPGEPNQATPGSCVQLTTSSGDWQDEDCADSSGAVCEKEIETVKASFYELHRGPEMDVTPLRNVGGFSKVYCAMVCSAETECHALKPITSGNDVTCELYAEPKSNNIVSMADIYVKNK